MDFNKLTYAQGRETTNDTLGVHLLFDIREFTERYFF